MGLKERFKVLFRRPLDGARYVSLEARVVNPSTVTSPITGFQAALLLWVAQTEQMVDQGKGGPKLMIEEIGRAVRGSETLVLSTDRGELELDAGRAKVLLDRDGGQLLSGQIPDELTPMMSGAASVYVREWSVRKGDRVRVRGYLDDVEKVRGGYRDGGRAQRPRFRTDLSSVTIQDILT